MDLVSVCFILKPTISSKLFPFSTLRFSLILSKVTIVSFTEKPKTVSKAVINNISIFKGKSRWGTILMGRATKEIEEADFYYIKNILEK